MSAKLLTAAAILALAIGAIALADAPQPAKPVPSNLYSGRWYEIARTDNKLQAGCEGDTNDFSDWTGDAFQVVQTCHKGSLAGPVKTYSAKGHILPATDNAKMRLGYFGGLISQEYWIVDRSEDNQWAIMARPDGRYVWLMSRQPVLAPGVRNQALGRIQALGFDMSRLAFPEQPPPN